MQVNNNLSKDDLIIIKKLNLDNDCKLIGTFRAELNCFQSVQKTIQTILIKKGPEFQNSCEKGASAEPKYFMERGYGCCVQYSRLIEKTLNYYEFETRHVFMIKSHNGNSLFNILPLNQQSHAGTEVLTSIGWMGVDSISPIIMVNNKNNKFRVYKYKDIIDNKKIRELFTENNFYDQDLDLIYGLYSRHGKFYGLNFPGPEFNLREILYNL
tara:strand:- start:676 stop:1311 length:636 start_codon:yes stop_codon:yes gene_type:complete